MKLVERADAYMNMGDLDQNQQRVTQDSGIGDIEPGEGRNMNNEPHQQLGSLGFLLGSLIAGTTTPERALESVEQSEMLSDSMKRLILKTVEEEKGRLSSYQQTDHSESSDIEQENTYLQESLKKKIKANFDRFIL